MLAREHARDSNVRVLKEPIELTASVAVGTTAEGGVASGPFPRVLRIRSLWLYTAMLQENLMAMSNQQVAPREVDHATALRGFFLIMDAWNVGVHDARSILGSPPERTYFAWRKGEGGVRMPADTLRRIGYIAGIYGALQILYSDHDLADTWVKRPNRAFGDQTPLQRMSAGDVTDLAAVRIYLDAARAPWS